MNRLPAEQLTTLRAAMAHGAIPDYGDPHYDAFYDTFGDLCCNLGEEADASGTDTMSAARRRAHALASFWSAIPADGLLTGVAVNQPELAPAALEAARSLNLPLVASLVEKALEGIPPEVLSLDSPDARYEWYEAHREEPRAKALDALEEEMQDGDFGVRLFDGLFGLVLREPDQFFETT